ncbi:N-acetylglucosamine repressor [Companilactobacillus paralimentarius]|uniref:ROK family protein n=1 Tax=Companilactobacillus paralimentarius TaxID=83526 RepID=UPI00384FFFFA
MSTVNVRALNTEKVLQTILNERHISRSDVSKKVGINKVTISEIVETLIKRQLIVETGRGSSTHNGGRKPTMLMLNPNYGYTISIDFAYDYMDFMINKINGEVLSVVHMDTGNNTILERIDMLCNKIKKIRINTVNGLLGISLAFHGVINDKKIIYSPQLNLESVDIYGELKKRFSVPIIIENEANLSVVFERDFIDHYDDVNMVCISIHRGVGAGIILNNKLYTGSCGEAGEVGHIVVSNNDGHVKTFEDYCSEMNVLKKLRLLKDNESLSFEDIADLYCKKDAETTDILNEFNYYLTMLTQNIMLSFDPQKIVYNSRLLHVIPELLDRPNSQLKKSMFWPSSGISLIEDVNRATLLGGCANITRHVLNFDDKRVIFEA